MCTKCSPDGEPFTISQDRAKAYALDHRDQLRHLESFARKRYTPVPMQRCAAPPVEPESSSHQRTAHVAIDAGGRTYAADLVHGHLTITLLESGRIVRSHRTMLRDGRLHVSPPWLSTKMEAALLAAVDVASRSRATGMRQAAPARARPQRAS
jgi:hypothetical protein